MLALVAKKTVSIIFANDLTKRFSEPCRVLYDTCFLKTLEAFILFFQIPEYNFVAVNVFVIRIILTVSKFVSIDQERGLGDIDLAQMFFVVV